VSGYRQRRKRRDSAPKGTLTKAQKRERRERDRKLNQQEKRAAIRAKYGPSGKPAPVIVKRLNEFGEWVEAEPVDQLALTRKRPRRTGLRGR
jgi:hypothetical protein